MLLDARRRRILALALPIIGGMVSQNVLNLVDTAMVGHLGDNALAAIGISGFAAFMATALITGLSSGVQAMASRRMGEGKLDQMAVPLNGGLLLGLAMAIPLTGVLYVLTPTLFPYLMSDPEVVDVGVPYLQVRMLAIGAVGANFVFRGYWNGVNMSRVYMRTLIVMHAVNIALNYTLIFGKFGAPVLGATGAAIGTTASLFVGTIYYFAQGVFYARESGFLQGLPDRATLRTMVRLSVPSGLQNLFFSGGLTAFFWIIGRVGTQELAASQVLVNIMLVGLLPGIGFGLAAASLVGQALGKGEPEDARAWGWDVSKMAVVLVALIASPALVSPDLFLGVFLHNPDTLALARTPMRIVALFLPLDILGAVLMNALLGAGDNRRVAAVSIVMQWAIGLPLAFLIGPTLGYGLIAIWLVQVGYRGLQALIFVGFWRRDDWTTLEV
jgi:putative MATE family efflux protein